MYIRIYSWEDVSSVSSYAATILDLSGHLFKWLLFDLIQIAQSKPHYFLIYTLKLILQNTELHEVIFYYLLMSLFIASYYSTKALGQ